MLLYNCYHLKYPEELPYSYGNSYEGVYQHGGTYPKPVAYMPEFLGNVNCTTCEETPTTFISNEVIRSNAKISSIEGYYAPTFPLQSFNDPVTPATFLGNATFRAGEEIVFTDGFSVTDGATMHAYIDPFECENGMLMRLGEEEPELESKLQNSTISRSVEPKSTLYPNPTTGLLTLTHSQQLLTVVVYDPLGRQLLQTIPYTTTTSIDLSGQPAGIYIIRAGLEDGSTETHRVVLSPP
jgi:hypothetical protein